MYQAGFQIEGNIYWLKDQFESEAVAREYYGHVRLQLVIRKV